MKLKPIVILVIVALGIIGLLLINSNNAPENAQQANEQKIRAAVSEKLNFEIEAIADSPVPGLQQIFTDRGLFYASNDGDYFLQARVFNIGNQNVIDETEVALRDVRLEGLKAFSDSVIEFPAADEKYVINVFTDATCGYCRKLHNELQQYHDLGITVRYLAWPRAGIDSQTYQDTVSIWCSEDPQQAMTDAKAGKRVSGSSCANDVAEQYKFGQKVGVQGTPNIILSDGSVIPGYQPARQLLQRIQSAS